MGITSGFLHVENFLSMVFIPGSQFGHMKNFWLIFFFSLEDCWDHCPLILYIAVDIEEVLIFASFQVIRSICQIMQKNLYFCDLVYFLDYISVLIFFLDSLFVECDMSFQYIYSSLFLFQKIFLNYISKYLFCNFILVFFRNSNYVYVVSPLFFFLSYLFFSI